MSGSYAKWSDVKARAVPLDSRTSEQVSLGQPTARH
jgi:hypothetical protein